MALTDLAWQPPPQKEQETLLLTADGIQLQSKQWRPAPERLRGGAVICHPHPLCGGTMEHKVVTMATRAAAACDLATIRFNFRGVGRSTGEHGAGTAEVNDVCAAFDRLGPLTEGRGVRVLIGYSFGAMVCVQAVRAGLRPDQLVLIGLPLAMAEIVPPAVPRLGLQLIVGQHDAFCPPAAAHRFIAALADARAELHFINGADHFFDGQLHTLAQQIRELLVGQRAFSS